MWEGNGALQHVDGSLVLPTVVERLYVRGQVLNVTIRERKGLVRPVQSRVVQLLGSVLLDETSGFREHILVEVHVIWNNTSSFCAPNLNQDTFPALTGRRVLRKRLNPSY